MLKALILSYWVFAYPMNDSFMSIECFPEKGIINAFIKLKYTDFIFDYRFTINDDQHFDLSGKIDTTQILVGKYLEARVRITAGDKKLKVRLTNIESSNGELKLDFKCYYDKKAKLFTVKNLMFTEYREHQSNFLIFKYKDFEEGVLLTPEKTEQTFNVKFINKVHLLPYFFRAPLHASEIHPFSSLCNISYHG
jgi:Domain of unknown function (DUF6702)